MQRSIESEVAAAIVHRERISEILAATGGEIIHPDHYKIREAVRLAVLEAIDSVSSDLAVPRMSDGELPVLFRALDEISSHIFLKSAGL